MKYLTFSILFLILISACSKSEPQPPVSKLALVTVPMKLKQVSDHVYYVQGEPGVATDNEGFVSNAGFVVTNAGVVVFDALGSPSLAELLIQKIRTVTDKPIVRVISSHYHADHIYGLQVFADLGAEIWAPLGSENYLASDYAAERLEERRFSLSPWVNEQTHLVTPDRYLQNQEQFEIGGVRFTVTPVGAAHSDGDLTLYVEPDRVLFSGDIIFEGRVPFLGDANSGRWLAVLEKMESAQLKALIPGHGSAASDPNAAISGTRKYLAFLRKEMGAAVDEMQSFEEVYVATDWSGFESLPAFSEANRRNAYQVYLSMEAESF